MKIKNLYEILYACTSPNRTVNAAPLKRLGLRSARSVATLAPTPHFATFLQPWSLLHKALIRAAKTSFTAGTLGDINITIYLLIIDK